MTKNAPHPWNSERFKIDSFRSGSVCAMKERSSNLKRATACWMRLRPTPSRTSRIRAQTASHFVDKHGPGIRWEFVALTTTPKGWRVLRTLSTSAPAAMQPLSVTRLINSSPFTICRSSNTRIASAAPAASYKFRLHSLCPVTGGSSAIWLRQRSRFMISPCPLISAFFYFLPHSGHSHFVSRECRLRPSQKNKTADGATLTKQGSSSSRRCISQRSRLLMGLRLS